MNKRRQFDKPKPVILFDANPLIGNKSGVGQYAERLLEAVAKNQAEDFMLKAYYFNFLGLKKVSNLPAPHTVEYIEVKFLPTKFINILHRLRLQIPLEFFLGFRKFDFIVFPNFVSVPSLRKTPYAVAVHDMCFEDFPEFIPNGNRLYLHRFVGKSVRKSSLVLTISDFTKQRIGHYYGNDVEAKTLSLPIPFEEPASGGTVSKQIQDLVLSPFILYVGNLEPRKNIPNLLYGLSEASEEIRKKYRLILVGGQGWGKEALDDAITKTKDKITVIRTGYLSDADRGYLYKHAGLVAYTSHYEGFGMQAWEAMYYRRKLLLSSIPVFHEIAGPYATYCDQNNPKAIAKGIALALSSHTTATIPKWSWSDNSTKISEKITAVLNQS